MGRDVRARASVLAVAALAPWLAGCTRPDAARPVMAGAELFAACVACHGASGEGNRQYKSPTLAGLPAWYVEAQLVKFQTGVRGAHPDDIDGLRMRPMSRQLMNRAEVASVARYIGSLPVKRPAPALTGGDADQGARLYGTCFPCHGDAAQGNEQLRAPPLAHQADWYLMAQLAKFREGVRGTNPADVNGAQMRPMALTLPNEQAMKNVLAHISTFSR